MNIGQKIQLLREQHNWSQEDLSINMNVAKPMVSKWELNEVLPDIKEVIRLCELFHISTDNLLNSDFDIGCGCKVIDTRHKKVSNQTAQKYYLRSGIIFLIVGVLIIGTLLTLSQIIPSRLKVTQNYTTNDISYVSDESFETGETRSVSYYITVKEFVPFLNTYYLHWLLAMGCAFICLSVFYFVRFKNVNISVKDKKRRH